MLLGLQNPQTPGSQNSLEHVANATSPSLTQPSSSNNLHFSQNNPNILSIGNNSYMGLGSGVGEMMMQSQEINMSTLGGDMMPWLEYLPQNILDFSDNETVATASANGGNGLNGG